LQIPLKEGIVGESRGDKEVKEMMTLWITLVNVVKGGFFYDPLDTWLFFFVALGD
jgi:hypothetical protein